MGKDKKDMLCLLFVPLAIFFAVWAGKIPVTEFYQGAKFGVHIQYHASFFLVFFARVLYTFVFSGIWSDCRCSAQEKGAAILP